MDLIQGWAPYNATKLNFNCSLTVSNKRQKLSLWGSLRVVFSKLQFPCCLSQFSELSIAASSMSDSTTLANGLVTQEADSVCWMDIVT